jgi:hypothetical protein
VAEPVLLISSDPFLGAFLEALAAGKIRVARLDPSRRPAAWPGAPAATVVLDVSAGQRDALHAWVRRHHPGRLVVLLKPGELGPVRPPDPASVVIARPFQLSDLVALLEQRPDPRNLLQASAEQRRRRLIALGAAPRAAGPAAPSAAGPGTEPGSGAPSAGGRELPRPDWPTASTQLDVRRRRRGRRARRVAARMLAGLLVLLLLVGAWLALGLLDARRDLLVGVAGVRAELTAAEAALVGGRPAEAAARVRAARSSLEAADAVPDRPELRAAARLPVLSGGVADTRRVLTAAADLTGAADRAVAVAARLGPGRNRLLRDGRFDLGALEDAATEAREVVAGLEAATAQLGQVRGGPLTPGIDETRRWAQARVEEARARAAPLLATLDALPAAVGAARPRRYLLVLTTPAGPGAAAGTPLAAGEVVLDRGAATLQPGGGRLVEALRGTRASASFRATGPALLAAAQAAGRPPPDGVVVLDPLALRALLTVTGPVGVPGYGRLEAAGAVRQLTVDAERRWPDPAERGRYRQAVLEATAGRLLGGRDLLAVGRAMGAAGSGGHLRAYAADPALERLLARHRLDGGPPATVP